MTTYPVLTFQTKTPTCTKPMLRGITKIVVTHVYTKFLLNIRTTIRLEYTNTYIADIADT